MVGSQVTTTAAQAGDRHGQREIQSQQAPRQRRHHRSHRPRQDHADCGAREGSVEEEPREGDQLRRHREGRHGPRRDEDGDDRGVARGVRVAEAPLRARRLPGPRRLHQEHDHGRGADGRRHPRGELRRRPDAADARARAARPPGQRAVPRRRPEQGRHDGRPGTGRPGRARGARAADQLRLPRRQDPRGARLGPRGSERRGRRR